MRFKRHSVTITRDKERRMMRIMGVRKATKVYGRYGRAVLLSRYLAGNAPMGGALERRRYLETMRCNVR